MLVEKDERKLKILTISGHPLSYSGIGIQARYLIEGLLSTGRYQFLSLGSAIKHQDYEPQALEQYVNDWVILPVDRYGNKDIVLSVLRQEEPDAVFIFADPRFCLWLFQMADEIRSMGIPILYWTVWDEKPTPLFNRSVYDSCDFLGCISKLTYNNMLDMGLGHKSEYIPHAVDTNMFRCLPKEVILREKANSLSIANGKFVVLYVSRNMGRKMTPDVIKTFKMFMDEHNLNDECFLLMHCDPRDVDGVDLVQIAQILGLRTDQIAFSNQKVTPETMRNMYNTADVTINISSNEGFGLSCLESLSCSTPVIVTKTGGLQDQPIDDHGNVFGVMIEPATKSLVGIQGIPYIFDMRVSDEDVIAALKKMYDMTWDQRKDLGKCASLWVGRAFAMKTMVDKWDKAFTRYAGRGA